MSDRQFRYLLVIITLVFLRDRAESWVLMFVGGILPLHIMAANCCPPIPRRHDYSR
jgi:hypothetical protein